VRCRVDAADINAISDKAKLLPEDWQEWLPINSAPYTSTVVFLVRAGNPKKIHNWPDLVRPGIGVITANPKTSGGARWNYLAAWTYASKADKGDSAKVLDYMKKLCANMPVLDSGSRGATTTFAERGIGDVLIAWENEVDLAIAESSGKGFEIVVPSIGIRAEPPVAVVDDVATRHGTLDVAKAYLQFLYTAQGADDRGKAWLPSSAAATGGSGPVETTPEGADGDDRRCVRWLGQGAGCVFQA
jgi:sulfate/thiosulfate-binding protein